MSEVRGDVGYLLNLAARLMRADLAERLRPLGLTPPQLAVLSDLREAERDGRAATPASVADRLGADRPTVTGIVERLRQGGLVESAANPGDKRSKVLSPTEQARTLMEGMAHVTNDAAERALAGFTAEERERFLGDLERVVENMARPS